MKDKAFAWTGNRTRDPGFKAQYAIYYSLGYCLTPRNHRENRQWDPFISHTAQSSGLFYFTSITLLRRKLYSHPTTIKLLSLTNVYTVSVYIYNVPWSKARLGD